MANGLKVVSVRIPAIEKAAIGNEIFYYNNQTPQEIAMAIKHAAQAPKKDSRKLIMELDNKFTEELNKLIEDLALTNY